MPGKLSFDSAFRALKPPCAPDSVYYLTGDEDLLKDELVQRIIDAAIEPASRDFNLDVRSAADLTGEVFHALVETPPMLADRRVVVVKNIELWRKNASVWPVVHAYLEHAAPTTVLVLIQGAGHEPLREVAARCTHVVLERLPPDRLRRWIKVRAERAGFAFTEEAAEHLLACVGPDLPQLATEIDKLAAVATDEGAVDAEAVASLVGVRRGETLGDWVAAALSRDLVRAVGMLDTVLSAAGVTGVRLVNALGSGLIGVRLTLALAGRQRAGARTEAAVLAALKKIRPQGLGDWSEAAALWTRAARFWTAEELDGAIRAAYECDCALKSTTLTDERGMVTELLLRMSPLEVAA